MLTKSHNYVVIFQNLCLRTKTQQLRVPHVIVQGGDITAIREGLTRTHSPIKMSIIHFYTTVLLLIQSSFSSIAIVLTSSLALLAASLVGL